MTVERGLQWAGVDAVRPHSGMGGLVDPGSLLEATPECLVVTAADGRILFANRRVHELTGFAASELVGSSLEVLLSDGLFAENETPFESRCRRADGGAISVEVHLGRIDGPEPLLVVTLRDITERKDAEEQVAFLPYHDGLTGLPNRALSEEMLAGAIARPPPRPRRGRHPPGPGQLQAGERFARPPRGRRAAGRVGGATGYLHAGDRCGGPLGRG